MQCLLPMAIDGIHGYTANCRCQQAMHAACMRRCQARTQPTVQLADASTRALHRATTASCLANDASQTCHVSAPLRTHETHTLRDSEPQADCACSRHDDNHKKTKLDIVRTAAGTHNKMTAASPVGAHHGLAQLVCCCLVSSASACMSSVLVEDRFTFAQCAS